jgi:uncharacterized protein YndB with AHSA1/START domain
MAHFTIEQTFACAPAELWPWLTVPSRMNRWSGAAVVLEAAGEDGGPASPGARRRVELPIFGAILRLHEVVLEARPPERFVYSVTKGPGLKAHRGEIELSAAGGGTRLSWRVEFKTSLPGAEPLFTAIVRPKLLSSVRALAVLVAGGPSP